MKETLQERMIKYRAKEGIGQREMARRCNLAVQTVNSVENGLQKPTKLTEAKIYLVIGENENEEV